MTTKAKSPCCGAPIVRRVRPVRKAGKTVNYRFRECSLCGLALSQHGPATVKRWTRG